MLATLTPATRIFVAVAPVDLRRGFEGLTAYVERVLQQQVMEGLMARACGRRPNAWRAERCIGLRVKARLWACGRSS